MERTEIENRLRSLLVERAQLVSAYDIDRQASLLDLGLDSTAIVSLVVGLEEAFDMEIADADISAENFQNLDTVSRLVEASSTR